MADQSRVYINQAFHDALESHLPEQADLWHHFQVLTPDQVLLNHCGINYRDGINTKVMRQNIKDLEKNGSIAVFGKTSVSFQPTAKELLSCVGVIEPLSRLWRLHGVPEDVFRRMLKRAFELKANQSENESNKDWDLVAVGEKENGECDLLILRLGAFFGQTWNFHFFTLGQKRMKVTFLQYEIHGPRKQKIEK